MEPRTQWIFRRQCGCPFGVLDGACAEGEGQALRYFYPKLSDLGKALDRGVTVERMTHRRYVAEVYPQLLSDYGCPHLGEGES